MMATSSMEFAFDDVHLQADLAQLLKNQADVVYVLLFRLAVDKDII